MFKVSIKVTGIDESIRSVEQLVNGVSQRMSDLGLDTVEFMRTTIHNSAKRGSMGNLGNAIRKYQGYFGPVEWVGVGLIDELNQKAPYWSVVNYGGYVPPANIGMFENTGAPDSSLTGRGTEVWHHVGTAAAAYGLNFWFMRPKSPIRPMNYIESTLSFLSVVWQTYFGLGAVQAAGSMTGPGLSKGGFKLGK